MSGHHVKVELQFDQMKSLVQDAEKEGMAVEEQVSVSSPSVSVSPDVPSISRVGRATTNTSSSFKNRSKSRGKQAKEERNPSVKNTTDQALQSSVSGKNLNRLEHDRILQIRGTGKVLQAKSEANGNYMNNPPLKNVQDTHHENGFKPSRMKKQVTVDTSKAKTSLEALKLSIKLLKWKEVW